MLGRPSHVFLMLAQAYIFGIRHPIYQSSLTFPCKTSNFLYVSNIRGDVFRVFWGLFGSVLGGVRRGVLKIVSQDLGGF